MIDPIESAKGGRWGEVKQFLQDNDFLSVYEIAIQVGRSPSTVRNWRRKTGLSKEYPFKTRPETKRREIKKIADQNIWDNGEWFKEQYEDKKIGIAMIAKIIDRSPRLVAIRLDKYGIETRSHSQAVRSVNPCSGGEWLIYHYGTREEYVKSTDKPDKEGGKGWSLKKCAGVADVVPATIYNWLVRATKDGHNVSIRDLNESVAGERNPFYGKKHTEATKERLRQTSRAYIKSRAEKRAKEAKEQRQD